MYDGDFRITSQRLTAKIWNKLYFDIVYSISRRLKNIHKPFSTFYSHYLHFERMLFDFEIVTRTFFYAIL